MYILILVAYSIGPRGRQGKGSPSSASTATSGQRDWSERAIKREKDALVFWTAGWRWQIYGRLATQTSVPSRIPWHPPILLAIASSFWSARASSRLSIVYVYVYVYIVYLLLCVEEIQPYLKPSHHDGALFYGMRIMLERRRTRIHWFNSHSSLFYFYFLFIYIKHFLAPWHRYIFHFCIHYALYFIQHFLFINKNIFFCLLSTFCQV